MNGQDDKPLVTSLPDLSKGYNDNTIVMKQITILSTILCLIAGTIWGQNSNETFKLDLIKSVPSAFDGCSAVYTFDTTSLKKRQYILLWDLQEAALIKVRGEEIKLKTISQTEMTNSGYKATFKGNGHTVILIIKSVKQTGDESSLDKGSLEVIKGSYSLIIKIHGEYGC